jgi:hypothetical protein
MPGPGEYEKDMILNQLNSSITTGGTSDRAGMIAKINANYLHNALSQPTIERKMECPFVDAGKVTSSLGPGNYFFQDSKDKIL